MVNPLYVLYKSQLLLLLYDPPENVNVPPLALDPAVAFQDGKLGVDSRLLFANLVPVVYGETKVESLRSSLNGAAQYIVIGILRDALAGFIAQYFPSLLVTVSNHITSPLNHPSPIDIDLFDPRGPAPHPAILL